MNQPRAMPMLSDARLRARIQAADMVVVGRVVSIQAHTMQAAGAPPRRITEHDPEWREAVIQDVLPSSESQRIRALTPR